MTAPPPYGEHPPTPALDYPEPAPYPVGPGYPAPGGYPVARRTNSMAIGALVSSFLFPPLGIVLGHISLSQLKRAPEDGKGMAIAGLVVGYVLTALTILVIVVSVLFALAVVRYTEEFANEYPSYGGPSITAAPNPQQALPPFNPPATLGSNCQYPLTIEKPSKPVDPPRAGKVLTTPPIVEATITTNVGVIGLQLDNQKAPCTVNNFASLAQQGFFDGSRCHRLTTSATLGVLQCGDPTGTGTGGPGYQFPSEYPTNQYRITDPALKQPVIYPRGTVAMANAGAGTNGSQFFLVYEDSSLPPSYTVFGTIDMTALTVLDEVARAGVKGGGDDGEPAVEVTIETVRME